MALPPIMPLRLCWAGPPTPPCPSEHAVDMANWTWRAIGLAVGCDRSRFPFFGSIRSYSRTAGAIRYGSVSFLQLVHMQQAINGSELGPWSTITPVVPAARAVLVRLWQTADMLCLALRHCAIRHMEAARTTRPTLRFCCCSC